MDKNEKDAPDEPDQEYVTIPYRVRSGEVVETKDVPKQWREQTQRAKNVADELAEAYQSHPDVARIVVSKTEEEINGLHALKIVVALSDMDVAEEFPAEKDGVEVEVRKAKHGLST